MNAVKAAIRELPSALALLSLLDNPYHPGPESSIVVEILSQEEIEGMGGHPELSWTARRFFTELQALSPLRIISQTGPSTFEAICSLGPWGVSQGYLNAITDAYHWHLDLSRFRHLRSADQTHARSGRRVLFFELREAEGAEPFLLIYLYRAPKEEFGRDREERFVALHAELAQGRELALDAEAA